MAVTSTLIFTAPITIVICNIFHPFISQKFCNIHNSMISSTRMEISILKISISSTIVTGLSAKVVAGDV